MSLQLLIAVLGPWFIVALALEFAAVFVEQAGGARSPEDDAPRRGVGVIAVIAASAITPGLLLTHAFLATPAPDREGVLLWALGAPIATVLGGSLLGAVAGAIAPAAAGFMRAASAPLALAALAVTLYATSPSIQFLIEAARNGGVVAR